MPSGYPLSLEQKAEIRRLRADGLTLDRVAAILGLTYMTIRRHAPGRPGKVPVAPVREAFLRSHRSAADVARYLGWFHNHSADGARVRRTLGLLPDVSHGCRSFRTLVDAETVGMIAEAIGIMPWEVLPDGEAAGSGGSPDPAIAHPNP